MGDKLKGENVIVGVVSGGTTYEFGAIIVEDNLDVQAGQAEADRPIVDVWVPVTPGLSGKLTASGLVTGLEVAATVTAGFLTLSDVPRGVRDPGPYWHPNSNTA